MRRLLMDLWAFTWSQKKYWLIPIVLALALVGALIIFGETAATNSYIYPFF